MDNKDKLNSTKLSDRSKTVRQHSKNLIAQSKILNQQYSSTAQYMQQLYIRMAKLEADLQSLKPQINRCIDFIPLSAKDPKTSWAMLMVYADDIRDRHFVSAN